MPAVGSVLIGAGLALKAAAPVVAVATAPTGPIAVAIAGGSWLVGWGLIITGAILFPVTP